MTNATQSPARGVEVIRVDQDAADPFMNRFLDGSSFSDDRDDLAQAFARHRIAHQSSGEVERLREALSEIEHAETMQIARHLAKSALAIKGGE